MTKNVREKNSDNFALSCHFDLFRKDKLSPNRTYRSITDSAESVHKFIYAKFLDGATIVYHIYGLGDNGAGRPKIFHMATDGTAWIAYSEAGFSIGARATNVFFLYKDYAYIWQNGTQITQLGPLTGAYAGTVPFVSINYDNVAQPVHHKADDYAYFFEDNNVHRLTGTTSGTFDGGGTTPVLVLPTNMKIVGGASYGNYLAIVCSPLEAGTTNSVMYLWDRDSSLATISAKIDLGMGEAIHVSEAEDGGIFITQRIKTSGSMGNYNNSIQVKYFNGFFETIEIPFASIGDYFENILLYGNAQETKNVFYFPAQIKTDLDNETRNVIFAARRKNGKLELIVDQEITGVTQNINGIFFLNGHWLISYDTAAKTLITKGSSLYQTAFYESLIFDNGDSSVTKKLLGVTVMTTPLPTAGTVKIEYRKDSDSGWTEIFTNSTDNSIRHSAINIEADGSSLPSFKEIQFRISSTGGAEITGFKFKSEVIEDDIY